MTPAETREMMANKALISVVIEIRGPGGCFEPVIEAVRECLVQNSERLEGYSIRIEDVDLPWGG